MAVTVSETKTPGFSEKPGVSHTGGRADRIARKLVQLGFLGLFLYPLAPVIFRRITFQAAPIFLSWLLPWDPLLFLGHLLHRDWAGLVIGAPLLLIALTLIFGRAFCGWVCPIGTVLDLVRPLAFWQGTTRRSMTRSPRIARMNTEGKQSGSSVPVRVRLFPANVNSPLRYYLKWPQPLDLRPCGAFSVSAGGFPTTVFWVTA
jgi:hypothetical protein